MEPRPSFRRRGVLGALATSMLLPAITARLAFAGEETHPVSTTNNYPPVRVSARIVWTRFWDSGGLFKHPCLTGFER